MKLDNEVNIVSVNISIINGEDNNFQLTWSLVKNSAFKIGVIFGKILKYLPWFENVNNRKSKIFEMISSKLKIKFEITALDVIICRQVYLPHLAYVAYYHYYSVCTSSKAIKWA